MARSTRSLAPFTFHDPRARGFRSHASVEDVVALIDARVAPLSAERIPAASACARVLAAPVEARIDVPHFDRAAMDGYALRAEETFGASTYCPAMFRVVGRSRPGQPYPGMVDAGQAVAIATGAPLPAGADAVVPFETTSSADQTLSVAEAVTPGRHVGVRGEDLRSGDHVLRAGRVLRPQDLGILSALGCPEIEAVRQPRIAILITGDELLSPFTAPRDFQIADANAPMLAALVARDGGIARVIGPVDDDRASLQSLLRSACESSDAVLVSGGSSAGPEDHAPSLLAEIGELAAHGIALRPASPAGLGFIGRVPVVLLPGNPVSCLCAYDFFGGRVVRRLAGLAGAWPYRSIVRPLVRKLVSALGRVDYCRVCLEHEGVVPLATSGASILSSTTSADGFVIVPAPSEGLPQGAEVTVWLYDL